MTLHYQQMVTREIDRKYCNNAGRGTTLVTTINKYSDWEQFKKRFIV